MAVMREEHCCSVTLIVVGDDLDPEVVTTALGWPPDQSWRRGERKRFTRPDGTERVFDSVHDRGGWKLFTAGDERGRSLHGQVAAWLERLRVNGQAFRHLRDRGWEVELDCFAATSECLGLPATVLGEFAGLGVGLALTFSVGEDVSAVESAAAPDPPRPLTPPEA
ncbi:MAG: hypothetical protein JWO38_4684 [Gemmataceae bacterium]|nr:hypothetical protein [Gemmataceae bacterium]